MECTGRTEIMVSKKLSPVWLKAAVAGGLWASAEIILGSFMHNLKIPMAGSMLAAFGTLLMIAFHRQWPEKGLIWRAGLICALMKSVSPSSVILGPMIGIMLEALLIEFSIRLIGKNVFGYVVGAVLSVSSALFHKVFSILIIYGFSVVDIYKNIFLFATRQLKIQDADPVMALLYLLVAYMFAGLLIGILGYKIGQKSLQANSQYLKLPSLAVNISDIDKFKTVHTSPVRLIIHILTLIGFLIFQKYFSIWFQIFMAILYLLGCIFIYKDSIKRLSKFVFWIQLVIMMALAIFFSYDNQGNADYILGFITGVSMILRALFVVLSFSAISIEIRSPLIKSFLEGRGLSQLYESLSLSFSALPLMIEQTSNAKLFFRHPITATGQVLNSANEWLKRIIQLENLKSITITQTTTDMLEELNKGFEHFQRKYGYKIEAGTMESPEVLNYFLMKANSNPDSRKWWLPFIIILESERLVVGMSGFKGKPDEDGFVEFGYGVATEFRNRGIAGYAAQWMETFAFSDRNVKGIIAFTAPVENASVKVLKRNGFNFVGESFDPDDGPVWKWEKFNKF